VTVKRAPDASNAWVDGPGVTKVFDNIPTHFTVHAVDSKGQPVWGDECTVRMFAEDGEDLKDVPVDVADNGDGTYTCKYFAEVAGKYVIQVQLDGNDIKDTPVHIRVLEGADNSKKCACTFSVTFHARNKAGELKTEGGDDFEAAIQGPDGAEVEVSARDKGDGSYSCKYTLTPADDTPAEYTVSLQLNGGHIAGSPFKQFL